MNNCEWFSLFSHAFTHNAWLMFLEFWLEEHMRVEAVKIPRSMVFFYLTLPPYCESESFYSREKMVPWARLLVFEWYLRKKHGRHGWTPWKNWCLKHFNRDPLYQGFKKRVPNQLAKSHQNKVMMFPRKDTETSNLGDGHLSWDHVWTKLKSWLTLDTVRHGWVGNMSGYGNREANIGT